VPGGGFAGVAPQAKAVRPQLAPPSNVPTHRRTRLVTSGGAAGDVNVTAGVASAAAVRTAAVTKAAPAAPEMTHETASTISLPKAVLPTTASIVPRDVHLSSQRNVLMSPSSALGTNPSLRLHLHTFYCLPVVLFASDCSLWHFLHRSLDLSFSPPASLNFTDPPVLSKEKARGALAVQATDADSGPDVSAAAEKAGNAVTQPQPLTVVTALPDTRAVSSVQGGSGRGSGVVIGPAPSVSPAYKIAKK
jgi:hypothetical protein